MFYEPNAINERGDEDRGSFFVIILMLLTRRILLVVILYSVQYLILV